MYLYAETYLAKNSEYQYLKEELKELKNVAERRHLVNDFVKYVDEDKVTIKTMEKLDKSRIGYKPEKGQSHYSRVCQNSGETQRRRPMIYPGSEIDRLLQLGYKYNDTNDMYERRIVTKKNGKNTTRVIRAIRLNNEGGDDIYYTCSPEENGNHTYIGFLTKSKNPNGEPMPCCFKKDQYESGKRNFFLKCIGHSDIKVEKQSSYFSDQLYILSDTNKIQPKRYGLLPKILDFYLNNMLELKHTIAQHYLVSTPKGYFFKCGIDHENNSFISAIANALGLQTSTLMESVKNALINDKKELLFTSLNNGDLKTKFVTREKYMTYLENLRAVEFENICHIITTPTVIHKYGLNVIIFVKTSEMADVQEEENKRTNDNCVIICTNIFKFNCSQVL